MVLHALRCYSAFSVFIFLSWLLSNRKTNSWTNNLGASSCNEVHIDCKRGSKNQVLSWNMYCSSVLPVSQFRHSTNIQIYHSQPADCKCLCSLHVKRCFLRLVFMVRKRLTTKWIWASLKGKWFVPLTCQFCFCQHNGCKRFLEHSAENIPSCQSWS